MSRVSEHEATIAVEAAARTVWQKNLEGYNETMRRSGLPEGLNWDDPRMNPLSKNEYREAVLPIVWAALDALPDPLAEVRALVRLTNADHTPDLRRLHDALKTLVAE